MDGLGQFRVWGQHSVLGQVQQHECFPSSDGTPCVWHMVRTQLIYSFIHSFVHSFDIIFIEWVLYAQLWGQSSQ